MFVEIYSDGPPPSYETIVHEGEELAVPACQARYFFLERCTEETAAAYAAELNRLGIESVTLPTGTSARTVSRLLRNCPQITSLRLRGCTFTDDDLKGLSRDFANLRFLSLANCDGLEDLSVLSLARDLNTLGLSECADLVNVSLLERMTHLHSLHVDSCEGVRDVSAISGLRELRVLYLDRCDKVSGLDAVFKLGTLRNLALHPALTDGVVELPVLTDLTQLQSLDLSMCSDIENLANLSEIPKLEVLHLPNREDIISSMGPLKGLRRLTSVYFDRATALGPTNLHFLSQLPDLESLTLWNCPALRDVSALSQARNLQTLELPWCESLADVSSISALKGLRRLQLTGNHHLRDLSFLSGLRELQVVKLGGCENLADVSALSEAKNLVYLDLDGCKSVGDLGVLSSLKKLRFVYVVESRPLSDLSVVSQRADVESFWLSHGKNLRCYRVDPEFVTRVKWREPGVFGLETDEKIADLSAISTLKNLRSLSLTSDDTRFDFLLNARSLQSLTLSDNDELSDLSGLSGMTNLRSLRLFRCKKLRDLSGLSGMSGLRVLEIVSCESVTDVSALSKLESLESLWLESDCNPSGLSASGHVLERHASLDSDCNPSGLSALAGLPRLKRLSLSGLDALTDLSALSGLRRLESLEVEACGNLKDVSGLFELGNLRFIGVSEGNKIPESQVRTLRERHPNCAVYVEVPEE